MVAHALTLRRPVGRAIKRTISLDVLLPMASALQVGLDELLNVRLEPAPTAVQQQVHPGHDWFFVFDGRVRLSLGEHDIVVRRNGHPWPPRTPWEGVPPSGRGGAAVAQMWEEGICDGRCNGHRPGRLGRVLLRLRCGAGFSREVR